MRTLRDLIEAAEAPSVTGTVLDAVEVHAVDGAAARRRDQAFAAGGHAYVYPGIFAEGVVAIERGIAGADRTATIVHELVKRALMKFEGLKYEAAHAIANVAEEAVRRRRGKADGETAPAQGDRPIGDNK
jgi:hypothetical protein